MTGLNTATTDPRAWSSYQRRLLDEAAAAGEGPAYPFALTAGLARAMSDATHARKQADRVAAMLSPAMADAIARYARTLQFSLHVPGIHQPLAPKHQHEAHRGEQPVPHDVLLDWLASGGRDFRADTATLREYIRFRVSSLFAASPNHLPSWSEVEREVRASVLTFIVARFDGSVRDTPIAANAPKYAAWKAARWPNTRPGIRTSQLRNAVALSGEVTVTGA